jgi:hypothetical protein
MDGKLGCVVYFLKCRICGGHHAFSAHWRGACREPVKMWVGRRPIRPVYAGLFWTAPIGVVCFNPRFRHEWPVDPAAVADRFVPGVTARLRRMRE